MRTKTLLCAAALAASALSSMAQSNVYSQNIVGYVNKGILAGNYIYCNPLDKDGTNAATQVIPGITSLAACYLSTWTGSSYDTSYTENGAGGWFTDSSLSTPKAEPLLPPGKGFFLNPDSTFTNTFVGSTVPAPGTTNTASLPAGNSLIGSRLPVGGAVTGSGWNFPVPGVGNSVNALYVSKWTGSAYVVSYTEPGAGGWFTDSSLSTPVADPSFAVGEGFFFNPDAAVTWPQTLP